MTKKEKEERQGSSEVGRAGRYLLLVFFLQEKNTLANCVDPSTASPANHLLILIPP